MLNWLRKALKGTQEAPEGSPRPSTPPQDVATSQELAQVRAELEAEVTRLQHAFDAALQELESMARDLDRFEKDLEEGLEIARRRENRIRAAVARAQDEFEESGEPGANWHATVEELHPGDGGAGSQEAMPSVSQGVDLNQPSSIPGVTLGELWSAQGLI